MNFPPTEAERLENLWRYQILDTLPEEDFDDLTALAARICGTKVSLVSLVDKDRQWFKSQTGWDLGIQQTTRDLAFCAHTILEPDQPMVVNDARKDARFQDNQLVTDDPNIVFYAGMPLVSREGHALGSLCVIDHEPKELDEEQLAALRRLAGQVVRLFELRLAVKQAEDLLRERESAYQLLRDFSHVIAHDLKAPVRNIRQAGELLREDYAGCLPEDGIELIDMIEQRASDASRMIEGVLQYSQSAHSLQIVQEYVVVRDIIGQVIRQLGLRSDCTVTYRGEVENLMTSSVALLQIFQNLVGNALKFNDKEVCEVVIEGKDTESVGYEFSVTDNGPGIPAHEFSAIFRLFHSATEDDKVRGHGVGLSIVQRLVEAMGGSISVRSEVGHGTTFLFRLPKHS